MPIGVGEKGATYLFVPTAYAMHAKSEGQTKLQIAGDMLETAMEEIGTERRVIFVCDSWYATKSLSQTAAKYKNLDVICGAKRNLALYDLPPKRTGKRGRPRKYGDPLSLDDTPLQEGLLPGYHIIGSRRVLTRIFGDCEVTAIVTQPEKGDEKRLFLSASSREELLRMKEELGWLEVADTEQTKADPNAVAGALAMKLYAKHWPIEVGCEEKRPFGIWGDTWFAGVPALSAW